MPRRILCCLCAAVLLLPGSVPALAADSSSPLFTYERIPGGLSVLGYNGTDSTVVIPSSWNGEPVIALSEYSFAQETELTSVVIPDSVTEIGIGAFSGCSRLKTCMLPPDLTALSDSLFFGCTSLTGLSIPSSVASIGISACENCSSLTDLIVPYSVTSIALNAFSGCTGLSQITVSNASCRIADQAATFPQQAELVGYPNSTLSSYAARYQRLFHPLSVCSAHQLQTLSYSAPTCTQDGQALRHCTICGYTTTETTPSTGHQTALRNEIPPTCTESGQTAEQYCTVCETILSVSTPVPAVGHQWTSATIPAQPGYDGYIGQMCSSCMEGKPDRIISAPMEHILSRTEYTYSGQKKNPSITVTDSTGAVIPPAYYTAARPSGCTKVGRYSVTVSFIGTVYTGSITEPFVIRPKATAITSVRSHAHGFSVVWQRKTKQVSGYQLQYSSSRSFPKSSRVTKTIADRNTTSKSISGLKTTRNYYVRVRTYQTVSGKKIYSKWSSKAKIQTS